MKTNSRFLIILILFAIPLRSVCQTDTDPPVSPVFTLLSVQPSTGRTEFFWTKSPSKDVAGYVVYNYRNGEGFAFDTIRDPNAVSYINMGAFAGDRSESYVIAAIDSSGNISPLSNELRTIFGQASADTCNKRINVTWNNYPSVPKNVSGYTVLVSEDGGPYAVTGSTPPDKTTFAVQNFNPGSQYCIIIRADLAGGSVSTSNSTCLTVKMQRPPKWINADQASVNDDNSISLAYTIDPASEIKSFRIYRKKDTDNDFSTIANVQSAGNKVIYSDNTAVEGQRYIYMLSAINNCGVAVVNSAVSSNMVLTITNVDGLISLRWNQYHDWEGSVESYKVFISTGSGFTEKATLQPSDTSFSLDYTDIMYDISSNAFCFRVEAYEKLNPYGINGLSRSNKACSDIMEVITVPNAFTPDNDLVNDRFRPVITFTPLEYRLIITDRKNNRLFETDSPLEEWDGTKGGSALPSDVYLWFIRLKTPSGKYISKTGTVTIIKNRQ